MTKFYDYVIFEESTSPLTTSNDGLLYHRTDIGGAVHFLTYHPTGEIIVASLEREVTDAYIAGYDEAQRLAKLAQERRSPLAKQLVDGQAA